MSDPVEEAHRSGKRTFMGVDLLVGPGVLVPRAETELLGRTAQRLLAEMIPAGDEPLRVVDMCCGSGNLACALAVGDQRVRAHAADLTQECIDLARQNIAQLGLAARVTVHQGDLFGALAGLGLEGKVDLVVCNPPYISRARLTKDRATLIAREPIEAFDGGPYGLTIHQRLIKEAPAFLKPGRPLLFEIGLGQERQIKLLFDRSRAWVNVRFVEDDAGNPRVAAAVKP